MSLQSEDKRGQAEHLGRLRSSEGLKQDGCLNASLGVPVPVTIRKAMRADSDRLAQNNRKETNREWQEKWETNKKTKQRNRNNEGCPVSWSAAGGSSVSPQKAAERVAGGNGGRKKAFLSMKSQPTVDNLGKEGVIFSSPVPSFE